MRKMYLCVVFVLATGVLLALAGCEGPTGPKGSQGEDIFGEVYARRAPGIPLRIFMTFTPLQGMSWSWRRLWGSPCVRFTVILRLCDGPDLR